ncbi:MAG: hypothetical protein KME45_31725 [Stenomitos rutilans HA7619-LM2]|jgi:hypothetical protein|nr:hypothetical protein [Stenomitos rutilans HA7619-LM2]
MAKRMSRQRQFPSNRENPVPDYSKGLQDKAGRRGLEDQDRDKTVYRYLLTLTDLGLTKDEAGNPKINESYVAKQWGLEDNRIFVRRVLRAVLHEYYPDEKNHTVPGLTLGKLVKILAALEKFWSLRKRETAEGKVPRILTRAEKWRALRTFWQLSLEERDELGLPIHSGEILLQQMLENATDPVKGLSKEDITHLYETFLCYHQLNRTIKPRSELPEQGKAKSQQEQLSAYNIRRNQALKRREEFVRETIEGLIDEYFEGLDKQRKIDKIQNFYDKVQREISRIEFQSGLKQIKPLIGKEIVGSDVYELTSEFVKRLAQSIVENEILTDEFPIYLKHVEVEKIQPLPLYVKREGQEFGLLNPFLLDKEGDEESINGLEEQYVYKVKVHFYIKLPGGYKTKFLDNLDKRVNRKQLHFFEEIVGIGSPLSHITAAINRVLLWDIPCLNEYLPIVKQILLKDEVIGRSHSSPVWTHSLVKLCKKTDVDRAIREGKHYEVVDTNLEPAYGDFCGFDFMEVSAKVALSARLRAIRQTGVSPKVYLEQICNRVEEYEALRNAKNLLNFYPFSLRAMEGYLNTTIFRQGKYRTADQTFNFKEENATKPWSLVAYEAHLSLTEAYLREGLYRCAKKHLDVIEPHLQNFEQTISSLIYAKYYLYLFQYRLLADLTDQEYTYSDRYQAIQAAVDSLDQAEDWLKYRLKICHTVDELSQSNIHPFFHILSRISSNRARLYVSFSTYAEKVGNAWETLLEPIRLLEEARIYSARDGNPADYAYQSAFQGWCYLMVAYLWDHTRSPKPGFSKAECLDWARRLIDHALVCYSSTGRLCYQQLKNNAGKVSDEPISITTESGETSDRFYDSYGRAKVQIIPFIRELPQGANEYQQKCTHDVLEFDLSILKQVDHFHSDNSKYLFGTYSSILLFSMGILEICDEQDEHRLLDGIKRALRMFIYCWAIAEDGVRGTLEGNEVILDRIFDSSRQERFPDSLIQGLYPHRISRMTDLGKIFMAVCKLLTILSHADILQFYQSNLDWHSFYKLTELEWRDIREFTQDLHDENEISGIAQALEQTRYNGHLADHYERIKRYFQHFEEQLESRKLSFSNITEARDKVVKDIFRLVRGESSVEL